MLARNLGPPVVLEILIYQKPECGADNDLEDVHLVGSSQGGHSQ